MNELLRENRSCPSFKEKVGKHATVHHFGVLIINNALAMGERQNIQNSNPK